MTETTTFRLALTAALLAFIAGAMLGAIAVTAIQHDAWTGKPIAAPFTDIQGHWAESYIEQIRLAGLTAGCQTEPAKFCPDRPLTRAEAAVFMARLLEFSR